MRAILGSYDSELTPAEYSPQLTRRMREAEDMVQKVHAHSSEMEVSARAPRGLQPPSLSVCAFSLFCPRGCVFISVPPPASAPPSSGLSLQPSLPPGLQVLLTQGRQASSVRGQQRALWSRSHAPRSAATVGVAVRQ